MKNKNIRFLIVDDFPNMRDIIQNQLFSEGYHNILTARNGIDALTILHTKPIDMVISDWNMPVMNGLEMVKKIRASERFSNVPVLIITAETKKENINQIISAGINDLMVKPFAPGVLYKKIDSILSGRSPIRFAAYSDDDSGNVSNNVSGNVSNNVSGNTAQSEQKKSELTIPNDVKQKDKAEILVVDDLPSNIDMIVGFLKGSYKLRAVNNGKKALQIIQSKNPPALILLDIMMPEMDGISVCKQIKSNPLTADIPVIFLTAKTDRESLVEGFEVGAVDYIGKPVNAQELHVRVKNHLQLKFSRDELRNQVDTLMENARLRDDVERMSRHDLKTPISSILSLTAALQEPEELGQQPAKILGQIESSAFLLMDMINQSLNLYKIEIGKYQFTPEKVNITELIDKVLIDVKLLAGNKHIQILANYETPDISCLLEELLSYSIFSNLIKNAIEASEADAQVQIKVKSCSGSVSIAIHNQTMVPEAVQNSFFAKYVTHGKPQGTGLGTYSAKIMTEVQNGVIKMDSNEKSGTTISLKFPLA